MNQNPIKSFNKSIKVIMVLLIFNCTNYLSNSRSKMFPTQKSEKDQILENQNSLLSLRINISSKNNPPYVKGKLQDIKSEDKDSSESASEENQTLNDTEGKTINQKNRSIIDLEASGMIYEEDMYGDDNQYSNQYDFSNKQSPPGKYTPFPASNKISETDEPFDVPDIPDSESKKLSMIYNANLNLSDIQPAHITSLSLIPFPSNFNNKQNEIHQIVISENIDILQTLFTPENCNQDEIDLKKNEVDIFEKTPLDYSIQFSEIYGLLIQKGCVSNYYVKLKECVINNDFETLEKLISYGGSIKWKYENNDNLLHVACRKGFLDIIKIICENEISLLNKINSNNETPLKVAIFSDEYNNKEIYRFLINKKAFVQNPARIKKRIKKLKNANANLKRMQSFSDYCCSEDDIASVHSQLMIDINEDKNDDLEYWKNKVTEIEDRNEDEIKRITEEEETKYHELEAQFDDLQTKNNANEKQNILFRKKIEEYEKEKIHFEQIANTLNKYKWHEPLSKLKRKIRHDYKINDILAMDDLVISTSYNSIILWYYNSEIKPINIRTQTSIYSLDKHPHENKILTGDQDKYIKIWDLNHGCSEQILGQYSHEGHADQIFAVKYSHNGDNIASGGADKKIKLWDKFANLIYNFDFKNRVNALEFYGNNLIGCGTDGIVSVWDIRNTSKKKFDLKMPKENVKDLSVNENGILACTSFDLNQNNYDSVINLFNLRTGQSINTIKKYENIGIFSIHFTPDGNNFAISCTDGTIKICKTEKLTQKNCFQIINVDKSPIDKLISKVYIQNKDEYIVAAAGDKFLRFFEPSYNK